MKPPRHPLNPMARALAVAAATATASLGLGTVAVHAQEAPQSVTYRFTGKVRASQSPTFQLGPVMSPIPGLAVKEGDAVTGRFSYTRNYRQDLDPGAEFNYNFQASLEVWINGHHLTQSRFVTILMDSATYFPPENSDLFGFSWWWGTEWDVLLDRTLVHNPPYYWTALEFNLLDTTGKAFTSGDYPATLDLAKFDHRYGAVSAFREEPVAPGSAEVRSIQEGFEFSVDTLDRVQELRTTHAVAWNPDASGYLETAGKAEGPYTPYLGDIVNLGGELVALVNPNEGHRFYRLSGPAPGPAELDNFDAASPGTAPDAGTPVGPWQFPDRYINEGIAEQDPGTYSVVPTASFDAKGTGNSLKVTAPADASRMHLAGLFGKSYHEVQTPRLLCRYDLFVAAGTNAAIGTYVGGDNASGGWSNATDRGPMLSWRSDGKLVVVQAPDATHLLGVEQALADYPRDTWLTVEITLDLRSDTYSVAFAPRGTAPSVVGANIPFRSGPIRLVDRFGVMPAPGDKAPVLGYLDNVSIRPLP